MRAFSFLALGAFLIAGGVVYQRLSAQLESIGQPERGCVQATTSSQRAAASAGP